MARRESRTSTGRTNRSLSALSVLQDDAPGRSSPALRGRENALNTSAEMLRVGTGANGTRQQRARSSLGNPADNTLGLSISAGKRGPGVERAGGDALEQLLSSTQRWLRDGEADEKAGPTVSIRSPSAAPSARLGTAALSEQRTPSRTANEAREAFLAPPMTPGAANKARLAAVRGSYSKELQALQHTLMSNEGRPLSALQKALVFQDDKANAADTAGAPNPPAFADSDMVVEMRVRLFPLRRTAAATSQARLLPR